MVTVATISGAQVESETSTILVIASRSSTLAMLLLLAVLVFAAAPLIGILGFIHSDFVTILSISLTLIGLGLIILLFVPIKTTFSFDIQNRVILFVKNHLLGFGWLLWAREKRWKFEDIESANFRIFFRVNNIELITSDNQRIILYLKPNRSEASKVMQTIVTWLGLPQEAALPQTVGSVPAIPADAYALMQREIRSWGVWSILLGGVHLLAAGTLSASWGIVLIIVGLASFYFREAAMFVIYGATLAWVALNNLVFTGGPSFWWLFALIQAYFAFRQFQLFFAFKKAEATITLDNNKTEQPATLAGRIFPWAGFALGSLSLLGFCSVLALAFLTALFNFGISRVVGIIETISVNTAILGVALALSSVLTGFHHKVLASIGLVAGGLVLLVELALVILH